MRQLTFLLICFLAVATRARATMQDALIARYVLADVARTCVVRVDFSGPALRPPLYALAFSLEDVFWIYAPEIGTRVLGPATQLWPDTSTFSDRLRSLDAGVEKVTVYPNPVTAGFRPDQLYLVNACVIGSLNSLLTVLHSGGDASHAGLILMSYETSGASVAIAMQVNHSLLAYQIKGKWWCIDPSHVSAPFPLENVAIGEPLDPALVALTLKHSYPVKSVRLLPLSRPTLERIAANVRWSVPPLNE